MTVFYEETLNQKVRWNVIRVMEVLMGRSGICVQYILTLAQTVGATESIDITGR